MKKWLPRVAGAIAGASLAIPDCQASGYQFGSQSVSAQGSAFANGAEADDATTLFVNPAGISRLPGTQVSGGLTLVLPHSTYTDDGSATVLGQSPGGGDGGRFAPEAVAAPSLYATRRLSDTWSAGLGIFVPYGAKLDYGNQWVGRYALESVELKTLEANPSVAYRLDDRSSIGLGIAAQFMSATLTQAGDIPSAAVEIGEEYGSSASGITGDGQSRISGKSWGWGWNLGYMLQFDDATRLGVAYRSSVRQALRGTWAWDFSQVVGTFSGGALNGESMRTLAQGIDRTSHACVDLTTPETLSGHVFHTLSAQLALMGDVTWTRNSRLQDIVIYQGNGVGPATIRLDWRNTVRSSVGIDYRARADWVLRAGVGYDQSPVADARNRHPSLPDSARTLYAVGVNHDIDPSSSIDLAYMLMHFGAAHMDYTNNCNPAFTSCSGNGETTIGSYRSYIQMLGLQYSRKFQ